MPNIGIFWIYKGTVIGKRASLVDGEENVSGIIDSPETHLECWERDSEFANPFPELRGTEYQATPRGRVLFDTDRGRHIIYLGRELLNGKCKRLIAEFFDFEPGNALWQIDAHYSTSAEEIEALLAGDGD